MGAHGTVARLSAAISNSPSTPWGTSSAFVWAWNTGAAVTDAVHFVAFNDAGKSLMGGMTGNDLKRLTEKHEVEAFDAAFMLDKETYRLFTCQARATNSDAGH